LIKDNTNIFVSEILEVLAKAKDKSNDKRSQKAIWKSIWRTCVVMFKVIL